MKKLLMIMITIPSLALCQDTNMGVTLTTAQVQKLDDSITGLLPLVPSKYQGVVAGAILLLALASKLGRVYSGWRAGGFMGALRSVFTGSSTAIKLLFVIGLCSLCFLAFM